MPMHPTHQLIQARSEHVADMMSWFTSEEQAKGWGGPNVRFPFDRETFDEDVAWRELASFVMVAASQDSMLAFGQFYDKLGRLHLARLAVAPALRGRGLGGELIRCLIEHGRLSMGPVECSLWVATHNTSAYRCYRKEGFADAARPEGEALEGARFMVRPADSA